MPLTNTKFEIPERKEYEAIPGNLYQVQVTDITEKLKAPYGKPFDIPDEEKEMFINFELTILNEGEYRGRKLWKDMRPVPPTPPEKYKPSWMYRIVTAILGYSILYEDALNWDMERTNALIGEQLRVLVTKTEKGDKTYNNITEVLPIENSLSPIEANNEPEPKETQEKPLSGYEKARVVANSLPGAKQATAEQIAPDIAEDAQRMADEDINVDDIPFN